MCDSVKTWKCSMCGFVNLQEGPCWKCKDKIEKYPLLFNDNLKEDDDGCVFISFKEDEIVDSCSWGLSHPDSCKDCEFINCSKSKIFKIKSYYLRKKGK